MNYISEEEHDDYKTGYEAGVKNERNRIIKLLNTFTQILNDNPPHHECDKRVQKGMLAAVEAIRKVYSDSKEEINK